LSAVAAVDRLLDGARGDEVGDVDAQLEAAVLAVGGDVLRAGVEPQARARSLCDDLLRVAGGSVLAERPRVEARQRVGADREVEVGWLQRRKVRQPPGELGREPGLEFGVRAVGY